MTTINQKEYLKKYLGIGKGSGVKKKKIKSEKVIGKSLKIIDDDIDAALSKEIQDDLANSNEDAPQIVSVIDDRPPSLRIDEKTKDNLWKPIGQGIDSDKHVEDVRFTNFKISKETSFIEHKLLNTSYRKTKKGNSASGKSNKQIQDIRSQKQDLSPARNVNRHGESSPSEIKYDYSHRTSTRDENIHPPNTSRRRAISPSRKSIRKVLSDDRSPSIESRIHEEDIPTRIKIEPDDISPPRKTKRYDKSPRNTERREHNSPPSRKMYRVSEASPQQRSRRDDMSPPRRNHIINGMSPSHRPREDDISPPRRTHRFNEMSPSGRSMENDISPPRKLKSDHSSLLNSRDISPPRKLSRLQDSPRRKSRRVDNSTSSKKHQQDLSPAKRNNETSTLAKVSRWNRESPTRSKTKNDLSPKRKHFSEKIERTMSGKKSGLQNAKDLVQEIITIKQKEEDLFKNMSNEVSGKNAVTISRKKKTSTPEEDAKKREKEKEMEVKYSRWGKGLKQVQDTNEKNEDMLHEMSKPLARYADDEDLEKFLKEQERDGDPMLAYIRKKKKKKQVEAGIPDKPMYMGDFEPNRFGIQPGYRWDGVDRSNGYEKKLFESRNSKRAAEEEAMKWSTEDM
ncbi:unnamed protein product [Phaedon cochleariae]|uniref:BUD13 homolog n=1 Tax=Phaedon cochleariae TaxID=80249 RepID=A0A9N9SJ83_PHACE|nr:unnamed protein product [Phaedon cochleariae]